MKFFPGLLIILIAGTTGFCQVKLPRLISDGMILQRDAIVKLWGWAAVNEKVKVKFNSKSYSTKAGAGGKWTVQLPPTKAGGPYSGVSAIWNTALITSL